MGICSLLFVLALLRAARNIELSNGSPKSKEEDRLKVCLYFFTNFFSMLSSFKVRKQFIGLTIRVVLVVAIHVMSGRLEPLIVSNVVGFFMLYADERVMGFIKGSEDSTNKKES